MFFFISFISSLIINIFVGFKTRGVCFFNSNASTDNEKMLLSAKIINFFDWPSKMHSISFNRSQLREYWTISLKIILLFVKNDKSDHASIVLSLVANFISTIFIFFIVDILYGNEIALLFTLFYCFSFWPYYVSIYAGHLMLAQVFFLISIFFLVLSIDSNFLLYSFLSGLFIAISFFSSSSSRKYPIIYFFIYLYINKINIFEYDFFKFYLIIISLLLLVIFLFFFFEKIKENKLLKKIFILFSYLILFIIFFDFDNNYLNLFTLVVALIIICLHILLPINKLFENIYRYIHWLNVSSWASHFNIYHNQEKTFGMKLDKGFRGGNILWYHFIFLRFIPIIYILFITSLLTNIYLFYKNVSDYEIINVNYFFLFLLSISPVVIHEITGGLKVGKSIFTNMIFFLFFILSTFSEIVSLNLISINILYISLSICLIIQAIFSIYIFFIDILPSRMAPNIVKTYLLKHDIKEFYTYDIPYNDVFIKTLIYSYPNLFKVNYIKTLNEVNNGIVIVPPISSKSVSMETTRYAIDNGDFDEDKELTNFLKNKKNSRYSILKRIKTFGSSKFYVNESEVTSFRYHSLNQITKKDFQNGHGLIIKVKNHNFKNL